MTENAAKPKKPAVELPAPEDLSKEIELSMERRPDDRVKVIRLYDDCYRCNWWAPDATPHPFWIASGTIRKSRFLRASKSAEGVLVTHGA